jgi:hypothetical protein
LIVVIIVVAVGRGGRRWIGRMDFVNIDVFHVNIIKRHICIRIDIASVVVIVGS